MRRRTFLTGTTGMLSLLAGCIVNQPTDSENNSANNKSSRSSSQQPPANTTRSTSTQSESATEQPIHTTVSQRGTRTTCNGARGIGFYGLRTRFEDKVWGPSTVSVSFGLGAGAHVLLVVLENDTVLGMTQARAPNDVGMTSDGTLIPLNTKLTGEHTIRVVMYPNIDKGNRLDPGEATPCQYEGSAIQTEPTTIDFSRFSETTSAAPPTTEATAR